MRFKNEKLKLVLFKTAMTQKKLSRITGIPETTVSLIVNGIYMPDANQKNAIASALNKNVEQLFSERS